MTSCGRTHFPPLVLSCRSLHSLTYAGPWWWARLPALLKNSSSTAATWRARRSCTLDSFPSGCARLAGMHSAPELVVLLSGEGLRIGTADKATVHTTETPLHLAFSCHVFRESGEVLVTRRALSKLTWPGVWTNSFCGHPAPDEAMEDAIVRRGRHELGIEVQDVRAVIPDFRYRA